jgi:hypothetical protein
MSRHRRQIRLLAILARVGWQRDPDLWTILCLDGHGRRAHLSVRVGLGWVRLDCPAPGPLYLNPFHALRLRVAVGEAVGDLDLVGRAESPERPARPEPTPNDPGGPSRRQLVVFHRPPRRPTVADIAARLADPAAPAAQEADCDDHAARQPHPASLAA